MAEWGPFLGQLFDVINDVGEAGAITQRDLLPQRQPAICSWPRGGAQAQGFLGNERIKGDEEGGFGGHLRVVL
jgi:hypothetical protein